MPTFDELMSKPADEIKAPPSLPVGTYLAGIIGIPENVKSTQKQTDGVAFKYKFYQAREDVDREALAAVLAESGQNLNDCEMTDTFWVTERSAFMLKNFLVDMLEIPETTMRQMLAEVPGKQLLIHIRHRPRQDGSGLYAEIDSRAKAS